MKRESTVKYILRLTLTLLIICAVVAGILAAVNSVTAPIIAEAKAEKTRQAIAAVIPYTENLEEIDFTDETGMVSKVYRSVNMQEMVVSSSVPSHAGIYYAVEVAPSGFGGAITMMVGINHYGKVTGISIISHAETPGLGAVAAAENDKGVSFREQFIGLISGIIIGEGDNQIDALAGATVTSQAIADGVNAALDCVADFEIWVKEGSE